MNKNEDFKDIYLKYQRFSTRAAFRIVRDRAIAEDITQEVFYSLYKLGDKLDTSNEKKLRSFIFTATYNKAKDYLRKSSVRHEISVLDEDDREIGMDDAGHDPETHTLRMEEKEYKKLVLQKLHRENPMNYDILIKVKYLDIPPDSVAEEYGITRNNVNNRVRRTRIWLENELKKLYGDDT